MNYEITILNEGTEEIKFDDEKELTQKITKFTYKLNSIDDNSSVRDRGARVELTIEGDIDDASFEEVCKIAKWSTVTKSPTREIKVVVKDDHNKVFRTYEFDNMFCVDYEEIFEGNQDKNSFRLLVAQAPNYKKLNIYDIEI